MPSYIVLKTIHFYLGSSGFNDKLNVAALKEALQCSDTERERKVSLCLCAALSFVVIFFWQFS